MNTEFSVEFREIVRDGYYNFFESFEPDKQTIADMHDMIYRYSDDAFVINVKGRGLPDRTTIEILEKKFQKDLNEFFEYSDSYIYRIIDNRAEELSKELGVDISFYGRSEGYIGIDARDIYLSACAIVPDFDQMVHAFVNMALSHIAEDESLDQQELEDDEYLDQVLFELTEKNIDLFYKFVNIPILHKFKERVEEIIATEFSPESWAEILEPVIKDYFEREVLDSMYSRLEKILEPVVKKHLEQYNEAMSDEDFKALFDTIVKEYLKEDSNEYTT
jgi:hypothetical protein